MTPYVTGGYGAQRSYSSVDKYNTGFKECHHGNIEVFETHDGIKVYGGGSSRGGGWWLMEPIPDLAMGPDGEVKKGYSKLTMDTKGKNMEGWSCMELLEDKEPKAILEMDFPDYNIPQDCKKSFWEAIVEDIREKGIKTIHCMCMGGHGRTGVQLACLRYHLASEKEREAWEDANALIAEIRTNYCNKAVEADKQQQYVAKMCDLPMGDVLGFHKGGTVTTYSTYNKPKRTPSISKDLLECDRCDLVIWEDDEVLNIEEGDLCYDTTCYGHMQDITDFAVKRHDAKDAHNYQLCLMTMDLCSDVSTYNLSHLSEELMETLHGKEWKKLLQRLMNHTSKTTPRGMLLRNLNAALKMPTLEQEKVLVVVSDASSDPRVEGSSRPDYTKKWEKGTRKWQKCGFCDENTAPDRMTVAYVTKSKGTGTESKTCCPNCMTSSGLELGDRIESVSKNIVYVNDVQYTVIEGLSPLHAYIPRDLRSPTKGDKASDPKDIEEGLVELGLTAEEIEVAKKEADLQKNEKVDLDFDDFDDDDFSQWYEN